ncbi:HAD family hydrolase [Candidatus Bathyarchaeota archaeon]|nr:HAD family hydrolase [Candidatus Bathyarchaeota archaeon]
MNNVKPKGIVFDLDSTLVDSHVDFPKMKKNIIALLEENGHPRGTLSPTDQTTVIIMEKAEQEWQRQGKTEKERQQLRDKITEHMNQGELDAVENLKEIPGAHQAVEKLKKQGYRLAILTRGHHEYAVQALKKTGMHNSFETILARGETPQPKPYREAIDYTVEQMGLKVDEVVMIGDHQIDYDSAKNSGCPFIGVATGHLGLRSWENETPPPVLLDSVADLPAHLNAANT